jgi:hypothetical protein
MRRARLMTCVLVAVATVVLTVPSGARAASVAETLSLTGGACATSTTCLLVGEDDANHGAIAALVEIESQHAVEACTSDMQTVDIAVQAYLTENPGKPPATPAAWREAILSNKNGGPYLVSWPTSRDYSVEVAGNATGTTTGDQVKSSNGDVIVTAVLNAGRTYDYTVDVAACQHLNVLVPVSGAELSDGSTSGLAGVACPPARTTCYGVAQNLSPSEGAVVSIDDHSPEDPTVTATDPVALTTSLTAIACPTASLCVAVGTGPSNSGEVVPIVGGTVGTPVSSANESYLAIACTSSTLCFATGTNVTDDKGVIVPIQLSATPTLGTPVDVPSTLALLGAACPTATTCFAVGSNAVPDGVVERFSVVAGTPTPGSVQSVAGTSALSAIECLGAGTCDATGQTASHIGVLVAVSQGKARTPHPVSGTTLISGIACIGKTVCYGLATGASSIGAVDQLPVTIETTISARVSATLRTRHAAALTAVVEPPPAAGFVAFTSNGSTVAGCAEVAVRAGVARCVVAYARPGRVVVRAIYSGDGDDAGSSSKPVTVKVVS